MFEVRSAVRTFVTKIIIPVVSVVTILVAPEGPVVHIIDRGIARTSVGLQVDQHSRVLGESPVTAIAFNAERQMYLTVLL